MENGHPPQTTHQPVESCTFEQLTLNAQRVRKLYADIGVKFAPNSTLAEVLNQAERIAKSSANGATLQLPQMCQMVTSLRLTDAILAAGASGQSHLCLRRIARNNVNLMDRRNSQGKDALWELELHKHLKDESLSVELAEPDVLVTLPSGPFAFACKKVYSEKNLKKQLKSAAIQLQRFDGAGLIALNLDEFVPGHCIQASKLQSIDQETTKIVGQFLNRNHRLLLPYMQKRKCDGILLGLSVTIDVAETVPRISRCFQSIIWSPEEVLPATSIARMAEFRSIAKGFDTEPPLS